MAVNTNTMSENTPKAPTIRWNKVRVFAILFLIIGGYIMLRAGANYDGATQTAIVFEAGNLADVPHIILPTLGYLYVVGLLLIAGGILGIIDNPALKRITILVQSVGGVLIIPTLLITTTTATGNTLNITTLITESLRLATPLAIGAMAGVWSERAGVVNIAIEGMMLFGACFGFVALFFLREVFPLDQLNTVFFIAVAVAVLTGGVVALLHGWLSITFATDQIVSGTVINILAVGVTSFMRREYLLSTDAGTGTLPSIALPIVSDLPIIGETLFTKQPIFYLMFVVIILTNIIMFQTRWGLRLRAVGENPHAADTLGINVNRTRWLAVFVSGMLAGLAGAWFSLEATGRFNDGMTRGAGFIALAALIFGKWRPYSAFAGALLFGFADVLGTRLQILGGTVDFVDIQATVPVQFLQMVPYIVTLIVLAGLVGRAFPPKAVGIPYKKE
jgi:ABC-type uncharacterized transport system permease subunit